jgi:SAM-dependent methyltransferase
MVIMFLSGGLKVEKNNYLDLLARYGIDSAHPGGLALTKALLRKETITPEMVLLDVGCGTGLTSAYIAGHYPCHIVAFDINPKMLENARRRFGQSYSNISVFQADAMNLPFQNNSFHIVLSESVTAFTDIRRTLREYHRILKPGGVLLAIETTALLPFTGNEINDVQAVLNISYLPTRDEWLQMFQEAGFSETQVLFQQRIQRLPSFSSEINNVFHEYLSLMFRYRKKMGYGAYHCRTKIGPG